MRSAVSGDCHLVTNSSMLVQRFLDCETGDNLASLPEFHYARSKFPLTREMASIAEATSRSETDSALRHYLNCPKNTNFAALWRNGA